MSSTSKKGRRHGQGQEQGNGQRQRQSKLQENPEQLEISTKGTNTTTKQVELAMHTKTPSEELTNHNGLTVDSQSRQQANLTAAGQNAEELPEDLDNQWGHFLRVLTRCLMYCSARIATGFGLSRQQTAWYKHCWDNPGQRPRGISFLGAHEDYLPPSGTNNEDPSI
ncbi:uncharacterized protein LOC117793919 [Drosophila innubila]|uniref:uncharacterized protein LOC117793919 n=1 Tax=Drosophila innubila TaxID=198719 RepID=UPI00148D5885|nr:uncharacterized protein LOC117793919 [Drosophila innubila]